MINKKVLGFAGGILWGLALFLLTLVSLPTGYANSFLSLIGSIYPGYSITLLGSLVGLVYGFIDAFIGLYVFAWLYNILEKKF